METHYFTALGLEKYKTQMKKIEDELVKLQSSVAEVAETGGNQWHDNASYDYVTAEIRQSDRRLKDMAAALVNATIVDTAKTNEVVAIGTSVRILCNESEQRWLISGYGESDPDKGILAYNTPLASLVMGKRSSGKNSGMVGRKFVTVEILEISVG